MREAALHDVIVEGLLMDGITLGIENFQTGQRGGKAEIARWARGIFDNHFVVQEHGV